MGRETGLTYVKPSALSSQFTVLDYWRFTSLTFRYDFAKAKSALHQLVHWDVTRLLRNRRTCQNPLELFNKTLQPVLSSSHTIIHYLEIENSLNGVEN